MRPSFVATPRNTPFAIAGVAIALGAAVTAVPVVDWVDAARDEIGGRIEARAMIALSTLFWSAVLVWLVHKTRTRAQALTACVLASGLLGALNAGTSVMLVDLVKSGELKLGLAFLGAVFGSIFGAPIGVAYGVAFLPLVLYAVTLRERPGHDGRDRMIRASGLWLAIVSSLSAVASHGADIDLAPIVAAGLAAAGFWLACLGEIRLRRSARWLIRVAEGLEPGWQIVPREPGPADELLVPLAGAMEPILCDHVLALRIGPDPTSPYREPGGPYRRSRPLERLALVARDQLG